MTWVDWIVAAYLTILARRLPDAARRQPLRFVLRSTSVAVAWLPIAVIVSIEDWRQ